MDNDTIRLTQTAKKGGCAAKLPAKDLQKILSKINLKKAPQLVIGTENMDDACVWDLENGQSLIQTLDFFTPIVDDAYDFGAIAAANAVSDIYAMGGSPKLALSILAFPTQTLPLELLEPLMRGALDTIHSAGAVLAGGHSIDDETLKLGFSVTGFAQTNQIWSNKSAKVGDVLLLTKPLGTGTISTAIKRGECPLNYQVAAITSMKQLNCIPELLSEGDVNAATDITGFGLAGHSLQMAKASQVTFEFDLNALPLLPGVTEFFEKKYLNRAHTTNWEYVKDEIVVVSNSVIDQNIITDPQTSGGILLSVPRSRSNKVLEILKGKFKSTTIVGEVINKKDSVSCNFKR